MKPKQTSACDASQRQSVERSALPVPSSLEAPHIIDKNGLENTSKLVKDLPWIEFQVVDTGIGISGNSMTNSQFSSIETNSGFFCLKMSLSERRPRCLLQNQQFRPFLRDIRKQVPRTLASMVALV